MRRDELATDLGAAVRALREAPGFAIGAVASLAVAVAILGPVAGLFRLASVWPPRLASTAVLEPLPPLDWSLPLRAPVSGPAAAQADAMAGLLAVLGVLALCAAGVACLNVVALFLDRAAARRRELSIHVAHGATRRRLARRLLAEGLLVSGAGTGAGLFLGSATARLLAGSAPEGVWLAGGGQDGLALAWPAVGAVATFVVVLALVSLPDASAGRPGRRGTALAARTDPDSAPTALAGILPPLQVAAALGLLVVAGLTLRGASPMSTAAGLPFDPRDTLVVSIELPAASQAEAVRQAALESAVASVRAAPGVRGATAASPGAWLGLGTAAGVLADCGRCYLGNMLVPVLPARAQHHAAGPELFELLGAGVRAGREFTRLDAAGAEPVALVNALFAAEFEGGDPVGRKLWVGGLETEPFTIVGVVPDLRAPAPGSGGPNRPAVFLPALQHPPGVVELAVRTAGPPLAAEPAVRAALAGVGPGVQLRRVETMEAQLARVAAPLGWFGRLTAVLAGVALLLGVAGVHVVARLQTARRAPEFGLHRAVGARPRHIAGLVLADAARRSLIGAALGLYLALGLARLMQLWFDGVALFDPVLFAGIAVLLAVAMAAGSVGPARWAARADPVAAMREGE